MSVIEASQHELEYVNLVLQPDKTPEEIEMVKEMEYAIAFVFGQARLDALNQVVSHMGQFHPRKAG
jgi:hypothetical protein